MHESNCHRQIDYITTDAKEFMFTTNSNHNINHHGVATSEHIP